MAAVIIQSHPSCAQSLSCPVLSCLALSLGWVPCGVIRPWGCPANGGWVLLAAWRLSLQKSPVLQALLKTTGPGEPKVLPALGFGFLLLNPLIPFQGDLGHKVGNPKESISLSNHALQPGEVSRMAGKHTVLLNIV